MAGSTIRADADKIEHSVSVFRDAADQVVGVTFDGVAAAVGVLLPGGSAIEGALDRACGAAAVLAMRSSGRLYGLADFADEAHRFLETADEDFAAALGKVAGR